MGHEIPPDRRDRSDRALGIRTSRCVSAKVLDLEGESARYAEDYQPTPPEILDDLFVDLDLPYERFTFVDLGAGKGRVALLASAWPFARIVGVELSKTLWQCALDNLAGFDPPWRRVRRIDFVRGDAAEVALPDTPLVLYMYNPFGAPVLRRLLDRLERSLETNPRPVWVLYFEPVLDSVMRERWWIEPVRAAPRWAIYRSARLPAPGGS